VFALSTSLVELHAESSPDAVQSIQKQALPLAFFGQAGIDAPQSEHKQFSSFREAFDYYKGRILLLGDPGAGKTTTLLSFVRDAVWKRLEDPSQPLPITAPIATWDAQKQPSLVEWIGGLIPLLKRDDLVQLIAAGKALLALDGLDELGSESDGKDPRQQFLNLLPENNQVIVSCRVKDYDEIGQKAVLRGAITLHPLDDEQMRNYIIGHPDLWAALEADDTLREIARTPLLLSLFAYAFNGLDEETKKLRDLSRGDLRDIIFETYIRRRYEHEARKHSLPYSLDVMVKALQRAAAVKLARQYGLVKTSLNQESDFGSATTIHVPTLLKQAATLHLLVFNYVEPYRFIHLTLNAHFAYKGALALLSDPDKYMRLIGLQVLGEIGDERSVDVVGVALRDPDKDVRMLAAFALGKTRSPRATQLLVPALNDASLIVRLNVAFALGETHDPQAIAPLTGLLNHSGQSTIREGAELALKRMNMPEARAVLKAWQQKQKNDSS